MAAYLITGRGGTGKTTLCAAFQRHGYTAFDTDCIAGLARAEDQATGQPIEVDFSGFVDFNKVAWNWQPDVLQAFLQQHHDTHPLILCGSASNLARFTELFTNIFVLNLSPQEHAARLQQRTSSYGKNAQMAQTIIAEQPLLVASVLASGGTALDASQSVDCIIKDILQAIQ